MDLGNRLLSARMRRKLTQEQAAEALGVSRQTISNWENGKTAPDLTMLEKLCGLYNVGVDVLIPAPSAAAVDPTEEQLPKHENHRSMKTDWAVSIFCLVSWAVCVALFWLLRGAGGAWAMFYAIIFIGVIQPIITFVGGLLIGMLQCFGKFILLSPFVLALLHMLLPYFTFETANMILNGTFRLPGDDVVEYYIPALVVAIAGMLVGVFLRWAGDKIHHIINA